MPSSSRDKAAESELPEGIKERILERMPTRDAARSALLSTQWRDAWHRQGRLIFGRAFFNSVENSKFSRDGRLSAVSIINNILLLRAAPIKKFTLNIYRSYVLPPPKQSDIDRWCLFLSRNGVEELHLSARYAGQKYKVPSCLLSCKTIKQLTLDRFVFYLPANAPCMFSGLTSSNFRRVEFRGKDKRLVFSMPKLEKLDIYTCAGIPNFVAKAPNLKSLSLFGSLGRTGSRLLRFHLSSISTLHLCLERAAAMASVFPTEAINLQELKLDGFNFGFNYHLAFVVKLLKKSPKLCVLQINVQEGSENADPTLLEDLSKEDLRMLETVKLDEFTGTQIEMCLVRLLLSNSPALHHVVIREAIDINESLASKAPKKLLSFPRSSPKAQIVYKDDYKPL
ncbi:unnamed protein product [Cuscuta epithymum]|uniref:FBD domain-containing protein n=1 Tax=Cuscuta epithymum TaxID=186058 RepID=A0AAV0EIX7_9ASTE|nr:unnamed protein product [Cuscuta epithymum]